MCCIFTCCGWMLDLIQRVWVFFMSCCISSAICCVLITSSLSGVALGYNYSLAEYIDLKETNVSVFIKRGVFDDEVVDDMMDFRRKGAPLRKLNDDGDLKTTSEESDQIPDARRRLDDSIVESNERNSFEGSLMKLTLKPPAPLTSEDTTVQDDSPFLPVMTAPPPGGSLDQLKAIQGIINARKAGAPRNPTDVKDVNSRRFNNFYDNPDLLNMQNMPPNSPQGNLTDNYRRMMAVLGGPNVKGPETNLNRPAPDGPSINLHPARYAVPHPGPSEMKWLVHDVPPEVFRRMMDGPDEPPGRPKPITYSTGPIRPTTTRIVTFATPARSTMLQENTFVTKEVNQEDVSPVPSPKIVGSENIDYYDDEVKGLPVKRRRRNVQKSTESNKNKTTHEVSNKTSSVTIETTNNIPDVKYSRAIEASSIVSTVRSTIKVETSIFSKFKVGKTVSNEITGVPSVLAGKLNFPDKVLSDRTSPANEEAVTNGTKTV